MAKDLTNWKLESSLIDSRIVINIKQENAKEMASRCIRQREHCKLSKRNGVITLKQKNKSFKTSKPKPEAEF